MRSSVILLIFLSTGLTFTLAKKLPSYLPKCQYRVKTEADIPYFEEAFKTTFMKWRYYLAKGIPELRIPPLEPLVIPLITIEQNGTFNFVLKLHKTAFHEFTNYTMTKFKYGMFPKIQMNGTAFYKKLRLVGTYNITGNFGGINFEGNGPWNGNLTDITVNVNTINELYLKKGVEYLNMTHVETDNNIGKAYLKMHNVFGDNRLLNTAFNDALNDLSKEILEVLKPYTAEILVKVFKKVTKQLSSKIPYDEFFVKE